MTSKKKTIYAFVKTLFLVEIILIACLLCFIFKFEVFENLFAKVFADYKKGVEWAPLYELTYDYLIVVVFSSLASFLIGGLMGIIIHLYGLKDLKSLVLSLADFATTFPTVALIALLVPVLGYGFKPVVAALILYGILPILSNTLKGLEEVDDAIRQAAIGMGMGPWQRLTFVELPLAMPLIISGIRTSVIINIAAATVGAVVGAGGLGMPIVSGIRTNEPILILKGAIPVALIAMLADLLFSRWEGRYLWQER